jgi:hypothetical protein
MLGSGRGARPVQREENSDQRQDFCKEVQENVDEEARILASDASTDGVFNDYGRTSKRPAPTMSVGFGFASLDVGVIFRCRTG